MRLYVTGKGFFCSGTAKELLTMLATLTMSRLTVKEYICSRLH